MATRQSIRTSPSTRVVAGAMARSAGRNHAPRTTAKAAPIAFMIVISARTSRARSQRVAPIARRSASSPLLAVTCARVRLATFDDAISSSTITAKNSTKSGARKLPYCQSRKVITPPVHPWCVAAGKDAIGGRERSEMRQRAAALAEPHEIDGGQRIAVLGVRQTRRHQIDRDRPIAAFQRYRPEERRVDGGEQRGIHTDDQRERRDTGGGVGAERTQLTQAARIAVVEVLVERAVDGGGDAAKVVFRPGGFDIEHVVGNVAAGVAGEHRE